MKFFLLVFLSILSIASSSHAVINVSNFTVTTTSLSFTLTGDLSGEIANSTRPDLMLFTFKAPGTNWITATQPVSSTIVNRGGEAVELALGESSLFDTSSLGATAGDTGQIANSSGDGGSWQDNGGMIDFDIEWTSLSGMDDTVTASDLIIQLGFDSTAPFVGGGDSLVTVVPEPSSFAFLLGLASLIALGQRRR